VSNLKVNERPQENWLSLSASWSDGETKWSLFWLKRQFCRSFLLVDFHFLRERVIPDDFQLSQ